MLQRPPLSSSARERTKRSRQRKRQGIVSYRLDLPEFESSRCLWPDDRGADLVSRAATSPAAIAGFPTFTPTTALARLAPPPSRSNCSSLGWPSI